MYPTLFTLPGGIHVASYGTCLAIGFVLGTGLARRRARRIGADPGVVLDLGLLAIVFGVIGARLLYVIHYWGEFADRPNPLLAIVDISSGGIEFLGGFVFATLVILIYLRVPKRDPSRPGARRRPSIRLYLDIIAPSLMLGLAFTRIGCFLNGCCFGGICAAPGTHEPGAAWAVRFPFGSSVFVRQWEERSSTVPAELVVASERRLAPALLDRAALSSGDPTVLGRGVPAARRLPSRARAAGPMPNSELRALAAGERSVPVHPTQLYASAAALALSVYLAWLFRRRSRDGVVVVSLFILYPIVRFVLEIIRADNPHDTFGLTISQFISVAMFTTGIAALAILYKTVPPLGADSATAPTTAPATSNGDRPRKARTRAKRRR